MIIKVHLFMQTGIDIWGMHLYKSNYNICNAVVTNTDDILKVLAGRKIKL